MEQPKTNTHHIPVESDDVAEPVTVSHEPPTLITMPEHIRAGLPESNARIIGRGVISRPKLEGRYGNGVVTIDKPAGTPIDFPGFDAHQARSRQLEGGDQRDRPTSLTDDEIEEV